MPKNLKIILLIEPSSAYRKLVDGIAKYSRLHGPWTFYRLPPFYRKPGISEQSLSRLEEQQADGLIAADVDIPSATLDKIISSSFPTVIKTIQEPIKDLPNIVSDNPTLGKIASEHFLNRGFRNFAYCGFQEINWSRQRGSSFARTLQKAGFKTSVYFQPKSRLDRLWRYEQKFIINWLKKLTKPVALMACDDRRADNVIEACNMGNLKIPEDVAVLGVDNDEFICELTNPPLSSITRNFERAGYEAAQLLGKMIYKKRLLKQNIVVRPSKIVTRRSTDLLAVEDNDVAEALRFIRKHAKEKIQSSEVAERLAVSRQFLHKRFMNVLGWSVHDEITRNRIEHIATLLVETNLSVSQIALQMGFSGPQHIARYFQKEKGMPPLEYRKNFGHK